MSSVRRIATMRPNADPAAFYSGVDVGPMASATFTVWVGIRYTDGTTAGAYPCFKGVPAGFAAANGRWNCELAGAGGGIYWILANNGTTTQSTAFNITAANLRSRYYTSVMVVTGGNILHYLNGRLLGTVALGGVVAPNAANSTLTLGNRSDGVSPMVAGEGVFGFGGASGVASTAAQILDWHEAVLDAAGAAPLPSETHRWDAKDIAGLPASWTCRVSGQVLTKAGSPLWEAHEPLW